ncbi:MAG: molybdopterin-dependent oxidoreductase, partial [Eggerthella lenta]
ISLMHTMHFFMEAKENGTKYIVIDPVYNANAAKADWWIPVKAGTDGALALGVLNVLIENGWIEKDTFCNRTNAGLLIKEDGMFLRMSDLGVAPEEGPIDEATGKPTIIDPFAVWDLESNSVVEVDKAKRPAILGSYTVEGHRVTAAFQLLKDAVADYPVDKVTEICNIKAEEFYEITNTICESHPTAILPGFGTDHYSNGHYNMASIFTL